MHPSAESFGIILRIFSVKVNHILGRFSSGSPCKLAALTSVSTLQRSTHAELLPAPHLFVFHICIEAR